MGKKVALVTGITGQDGSYLAEFLLKQDYAVVGVRRRSSVDNFWRIKQLLNMRDFSLIEGDVTDSSNVTSWILDHKPDEVYNLAAQSHVGTSFKQPLLTFRVDTEGVLNILDAIRLYKQNTGNQIKFYQASTSEMFGKNYSVLVEEGGVLLQKTFDITSQNPYDISSAQSLPFQNEKTDFAPQSPYGISKLASHQLVRLYRQSYGIHASCGILFNHESPRRGANFVTRKITKWIGEFRNWIGYHSSWEDPEVTFSEDSIHCNGESFPKLRLGNLDASRDWGHAEDYVKGMWMMLQQETPDDYVLATGETHTIRDLLNVAFGKLQIYDWQDYVVQDPEFMRPSEVDYLCGDSSKAKEVLGWKPSISFEQMISEMVEKDSILSAT